MNMSLKDVFRYRLVTTAGVNPNFDTIPEEEFVIRLKGSNEIAAYPQVKAEIIHTVRETEVGGELVNLHNLTLDVSAWIKWDTDLKKLLI